MKTTSWYIDERIENRLLNKGTKEEIFEEFINYVCEKGISSLRKGLNYEDKIKLEISAGHEYRSSLIFDRLGIFFEYYVEKEKNPGDLQVYNVTYPDKKDYKLEHMIFDYLNMTMDNYYSKKSMENYVKEKVIREDNARRFIELENNIVKKENILKYERLYRVLAEDSMIQSNYFKDEVKKVLGIEERL